MKRRECCALGGVSGEQDRKGDADVVEGFLLRMLRHAMRLGCLSRKDFPKYKIAIRKNIIH